MSLFTRSVSIVNYRGRTCASTVTEFYNKNAVPHATPDGAGPGRGRRVPHPGDYHHRAAAAEALRLLLHGGQVPWSYRPSAHRSQRRQRRCHRFVFLRGSKSKGPYSGLRGGQAGLPSRIERSPAGAPCRLRVRGEGQRPPLPAVREDRGRPRAASLPRGHSSHRTSRNSGSGASEGQARSSIPRDS